MPKTTNRYLTRQNSSVRLGRSTPSGSPSEGEQRISSPEMTPTTMINDLNNSVEKRTKNMRQKLRAQHRSQIRKMDGDIRARFRTNKLVLAKYHRSELKRLSDLVKKRTELELKILSSIHGLNDAFEAATRELDTAMTMKLV